MIFRTFGLLGLLAAASAALAATPAHDAHLHVGAALQKTTLTKNVDRTFAVNATGDLALDNRYGEIRYHIGRTNEVKVAVRISAEAGTASKAQAILDRITVRLDGSAAAVSVQTVMDGGVMTKSLNLFSLGDNGNKSFKIDYDITAPAGFALDAKNRFGDTFLDDMTAAAQIDVQYGDLKAGSLGSPSMIEVSFGDGTIGNVKTLDAKVKYGQLKTGNVTQATLYSRFSEFKMGRVGTLDLDSQYSTYGVQSVKSFSNSGGFDDFKVDSVWSFDMHGGYCDVKLGYLGDEAKFRMSFGDVHIESTSANLKRLQFEGSYTELTASLHPALQYSLTAEASYADISTPRGFTMVKQISKTTTERVEGHFGANPKATIVLKSSFGDLTIK